MGAGSSVQMQQQLEQYNKNLREPFQNNPTTTITPTTITESEKKNDTHQEPKVYVVEVGLKSPLVLLYKLPRKLLLRISLESLDFLHPGM